LVTSSEDDDSKFPLKTFIEIFRTFLKEVLVGKLAVFVLLCVLLTRTVSTDRVNGWERMKKESLLRERGSFLYVNKTMRVQFRGKALSSPDHDVNLLYTKTFSLVSAKKALRLFYESMNLIIAICIICLSLFLCHVLVLASATVQGWGTLNVIMYIMGWEIFSKIYLQLCKAISWTLPSSVVVVEVENIKKCFEGNG